jgi:hypothetical protein
LTFPADRGVVTVQFELARNPHRLIASVSEKLDAPLSHSANIRSTCRQA